MVIAIDGPSGSGKTSSAKMLSEELGFIIVTQVHFINVTFF